MTAETRDGAISDPKLYAKLAEPFATMDDADAALKAFHLAVRRLRAKHRIADVTVVSCVNVRKGDGTQPAITSSQNGDSNREAPMLAWALGFAQKRQQDMLARLMAGGRGEK